MENNNLGVKQMIIIINYKIIFKDRSNDKDLGQGLILKF